MHKTGTATGHLDLLTKLNAFLTERGSAFGLRFTGTGTGSLDDYTGGADSVAEDYTLSARNASTFDVVGTVSGNLGTAKVGERFDSTVVAFTLMAGAVPFSAGDTFRLCTAPKWQAMRATATECIWRAPGNDGARSIYVGLTEEKSAGFLNLRCGGFKNYDASKDFLNQPGGIQFLLPSTYGHPLLGLWAGAIDYWFVADGRRVIVVARLNGLFQAAYLGFGDQLIDPVSYAYPLVVGGTLSRNISYDNRDTVRNNCFAIPGTPSETYAGQLKLLSPAGAWSSYSSNYESEYNGSVYPYYVGNSYTNAMAYVALNLDGSRPMYPVLLNQQTDVLAQLVGVHAVPTEGLTPAQLLPLGPIKHLAVPNVWRTGDGDYFTVALD